MGKVISLVNQKGGVGKTTTSINLAASLAVLGRRVLLIDFDPQGNATTGLGINKSKVMYTVYDLLTDKASMSEAIIRTAYKRLDMVTANTNLSGAEAEMIQRTYIDPTFNKSMQLKSKIDTVKDRYDYIIIDCPPSLGLITINALNASDSIIIPVQCEFYALEGILQILNTVNMVRTNFKHNVAIEGALLTMLDARTNLGIEIVEEVRSHFKEKVYNTIIPRMIKLTEAPSHGKPIVAYDPKCKGTEAYLNLAKEVIERNERK